MLRDHLLSPDESGSYIGNPTPSSRCLLILCGNRHLAAVAERLRRDADRRRGLAALELARVDHPENARDEGRVETGAGDRVDFLPLFDVELQSSITKPPSAELRPDQTDQDTLPPYEE